MKEAKKYGHRYDWKALFGNRRSVLIRGADFPTELMVHGVAQMLRNAASRKRLSINVKIVDEDRIILIVNGPAKNRERVKKCR